MKEERRLCGRISKDDLVVIESFLENTKLALKCDQDKPKEDTEFIQVFVYIGLD